MRSSMLPHGYAMKPVFSLRFSPKGQCGSTGNASRKWAFCVSGASKGIDMNKQSYPSNNRVTLQLLKELFSYDEETGLFTRIKKIKKGNKGDVITNIANSGYVFVSINHIQIGAHRLAWLYCNGELPEKGIDHINGVKHDNRIKNLRLASQSENIQNYKKPNKNNKAGMLGAYSKNNVWQSQICINRKLVYLGRFKTPEEANKAYLDAKRLLHPFNTL